MAEPPLAEDRPPNRTTPGTLQRCGAGLDFAWKLALGTGVLAIWLLVGAVLVLLALNLHAPPSWYFSISAQTEAADIELAAGRETQWRIEGAIICATAALPAPLELLPRTVSSPCGGRRWFAHTLPGDEDAEHVLVLGGATAAAGAAEPATEPAALQVGLETRSDGGLQMSIRGPGPLRLSTSGQALALPPGLNLIWTGETRPRDLVFPFTGERVRVGRDVTWSDTSMLREGTLAVFTASDESLAKRSQVEEVALMPGDQVRLEHHDQGGVFHPKGFVRIDRPGGGDAPASLGVVAFGRAESIRIERFGDSGYEFKPGWWVGILHDRRLMMASAILVALITVLGGIAGCRELAPSPAEAWRALRRAWRPPQPPTQDDER